MHGLSPSFETATNTDKELTQTIGRLQTVGDIVSGNLALTSAAAQMSTSSNTARNFRGDRKKTGNEQQNTESDNT